MPTITKFMRSKWPFMVVASRCFVPKSAQLSLPGNFANVKCPSFKARWTHKVDVSKCLTLPHPRRCAMPSAAEEPVKICTSTFTPKSAYRATKPIARLAARATP